MSDMPGIITLNGTKYIRLGEVQPGPVTTPYLVTWVIDMEATDPRDAAAKALAIQRNPASMADVFDVTDDAGVTTRVDLTEAREGGEGGEA